MNLHTKQKEIHRLWEQTYGWLPGEGIVKEFGMDMYTRLYLKWITERAYCVAHRTLLSVMWHPGWKRSLGENGYICLCMTESLCCPPETITTLLIGRIYPKTKSFKKKVLIHNSGTPYLWLCTSDKIRASSGAETRSFRPGMEQGAILRTRMKVRHQLPVLGSSAATCSLRSWFWSVHQEPRVGVLWGFSSICFQDQLLSPRLEAILGVIRKDPMPHGKKWN